MTGKAAPSARLLREPVAPASLAETLTEQAYRLIEEQIVTLRLKPGDILSEQMLSASCGIGRTPIREALQRLAREGLVIILPRKGILVSDINPRNQLLLLEVRRELERMLCRAGAERATREERDRMIEIAQGMDRAAKTNDDIAFMRLDRELNELMIEAAHNAYAARSMSCCRAFFRRFWYMHTAKPPTCRCVRGCTWARHRGETAGGSASQRQIDGHVKLHACNRVDVTRETYEEAHDR
jgi:DNA-binding GntR family transcriptional regulator